jgi:hypothetical protein
VHRERGMEKSRRRREAAGKMPRRRRVEAATMGNGMMGAESQNEQSRSMWGTQGTQQSMLDTSHGYGHRKSSEISYRACLTLLISDTFRNPFATANTSRHRYVNKWISTLTNKYFSAFTNNRDHSHYDQWCISPFSDSTGIVSQSGTIRRPTHARQHLS